MQVFEFFMVASHGPEPLIDIAQISNTENFKDFHNLIQNALYFFKV